jgi:NADH:ubiquinone oxidoreductase subunit
MPGFSWVKAAYGRSWVIDPQNLVDNHAALACCDAAWHAPIMSILEMLHARLTARKIGQDRFGNIYYEARKTLPVYNRKRRYVVTAHGQDPTKVPAEWHAWLHHTTDAPLDETRRLPWQKEHQPNLTGTPGAWRPKGHDYSGGQRRVTGGDYEAWTP